jgi:hypothetical protein
MGPGSSTGEKCEENLIMKGMMRLMALNKLILVLVAIIFLCNIVLYFVVQVGGESIILSVAITLTELFALVLTLWYWMEHTSKIHTGKFHHLP